MTVPLLQLDPCGTGTTPCGPGSGDRATDWPLASGAGTSAVMTGCPLTETILAFETSNPANTAGQ